MKLLEAAEIARDLDLKYVAVDASGAVFGFRVRPVPHSVLSWTWQGTIEDGELLSENYEGDIPWMDSLRRVEDFV